MRILRRAVRPAIAAEYNRQVVREAICYRPDVLIAFKGTLVQPSTLRTLRGHGVLSVNYYPDNSLFGHGPHLPRAAPEYDCMFYTKPFWEADVRGADIRLHNAIYVQHGYDPELHKPYPLNAGDLAEYRHDVVYVGIFTHYKERMLARLLDLRPGLDLAIWGNGWLKQCNDANVRRCVKGFALTGTLYPKALQAGRICLAILAGKSGRASQSDETSTRTFEIPACGGFMIHERTPEVLTFYNEGSEIECFSSVGELSEKIDHYLEHPEQREAVARGGYRRCVPSYAYDTRMREILAWCEKRKAGSV